MTTVPLAIALSPARVRTEPRSRAVLPKGTLSESTSFSPFLATFWRRLSSSQLAAAFLLAFDLPGFGHRTILVILAAVFWTRPEITCVLVPFGLPRPEWPLPIHVP